MNADIKLALKIAGWALAALIGGGALAVVAVSGLFVLMLGER